MAGHSHWAGIKHKKGLTDQKRSQLFSKLLKMVTITARQEPNPKFNSQLRTAIEKAKENNVPQNNIERAIKRASEIGENLEELIIGAYGPEGTTMLIEVVTDNKNRAVAEIKKILNDNNAKWAKSGSIQWAFKHTTDPYRPNTDSYRKEKIGQYKSASNPCESAKRWQAKFKQEVSIEAKEKIQNLIKELENHGDVQQITTNAEL